MASALDSQPRYKAVAAELLGEIRAGKYPERAMLPNESELCRIYNVSRITVRAAMRELAIRGIISRRSGKGTWVEPLGGARFVQESSSIEGILQFTSQLEFRQIDAREIEADEALAARLGCRLHERFTKVYGVRVPENGPIVCLSTHFVPGSFAAAVDQFDGARESLPVVVARHFGETVSRIRQVFEAVNLSTDEANILGGRSRDAALSIRRWYRAESGTLLIASQSLYPKQRFSYAMELSTPDLAVSHRELSSPK